MAKPKQRPGTRPKAAAASKPASAAPVTAKPSAGKPSAGKPSAGKPSAGKAAAGPAAAARAGGKGASGQPRAAAARPPGPRGAPPRPLAAVTEPVPLPRSVRIAVWLMYAGAVLAALDLIATLATIGSARAELHRANPTWTSAQLTTGVHSFVLSFVVSWVITIGVWLIMARTNQAGRAWARNVATVLSALSTLSFILYLHEPGSLIGKLLLVPMWLAGVAAAALLWRRESTAYIRAGAS
jgi:hypothetical protein